MVLTGVLLVGVAAFVVPRLGGLSMSAWRAPERSKPIEESNPAEKPRQLEDAKAAPQTPHVPTAIDPGGEGPISSEPTYSPDGREIAFWTFWRGGHDIWIVSTVDGRLRPLAADPVVSEADPAWSPTGQWIAFVSDRAGGGIWLVRPDGSNLTQLTNVPGSQLAWSPNGTQLAFVSNRAGTRNIWIINSDGGGLRRITSPPGYQNHPSFSPDGSRVVFSEGVYAKVGAGQVSTGSNLWIVNADGTGLRRLTTGAFRDTTPSWGVRGILFQSDRIQPNGRRPAALWLMQPNGSGLQAIPNAIGADPAWSHDGTKFAFLSNDNAISELNFVAGMIRPLIRLKGYFIDIDIMPRGSPKAIHLRGPAQVQVAILSTQGFNPVQRVDPATLTFGRTGDERSLAFCAADEVNGDGVPDQICRFEIPLTGFQPGDLGGILRFKYAGTWYEGRVALQIIP